MLCSNNMVKRPGLKQSQFPTLADVFARLGDVPPWRVLSYPAPGTAFGGDLLDVGIISHRVVEHVDGILVEKIWDAQKMETILRIVSAMYRAIEVENTGMVFGRDVRCRYGKT